MKLKYLDEYDFRARFVPAIFVILPAAFLLLALVPSARGLSGIVITPAIAVALVLVLVRIARDQGKKIEPGLVREWDGMPTTRFLRHRNAEIEGPRRERYRTCLIKLTGMRFPTVEEEAADPERADGIYAAAIAELREQRRGKKYPLVFGENCNYGMMRNLLGLRPAGIVISVCCAAAVALGLALPTTSADMAVLTLAVCGLVFLVLVGFVGKAAVKRTAEAYATALLQSCQPVTGVSKK